MKRMLFLKAVTFLVGLAMGLGIMWALCGEVQAGEVVYELAVAKADAPDLASGHKRMKAGDIIEVRPAGKPWGTKELEHFTILKVAGLSSTEARNLKVGGTDSKRRFRVDLKAIADTKAVVDVSRSSVIYDKQAKAFALPPRDAILADPIREAPKVEGPVDFGHSPARKMPLAYNTSTFGDGTRDYTSLATWEAATDIDLTAGETPKGEVLTCYKDDSPYNQRVTLDGATTSVDHFRGIMPAAGQGYTGVSNTGVVFDYQDSLTQGIFRINENFSSIYGLELTSSLTQTASSSIYVLLLVGTDTKAVGNIVRDITYNWSSGAGYLSGIFTAGSAIVVNNAIYGFTRVAGTEVLEGLFSGPGICAYNNTIDGMLNGIRRAATVGTYLAKNNILTNCTTPVSGVWTLTTNVTSGVTYRDSAHGDYRLATSDTGAKDQGTDLSLDAGFAFDDDVVETLRPQGAAWDVGFYELPAASDDGNVVRMIF